MNSTKRAIILTFALTLLTPAFAWAIKPESYGSFTWQTHTRIVDVGKSLLYPEGFRVIEPTSTPPWRYMPTDQRYTPKTNWTYAPKRNWTYAAKNDWTYTPKLDFVYKPKRYSRWPWHQPQPKLGPQIVVFSEATPE